MPIDAENAVRPPRLSIVIPTKNRAACLARLLASIDEVGPSELQVVVSDNVSDDDTAAVCRHHQQRLPLTYLRLTAPQSAEENLLNGFHHATGEFVWFVGDDDSFIPGIITAICAGTLAAPCILRPELADRHLQPKAPAARFADAVDPGAIESLDTAQAFTALGSWITFISAMIYRRSDFIQGLERHRDKIGSNFFFAFITIDLLIQEKNIRLLPGAMIYRTENSGGYDLFKTWVGAFVDLLDYARQQGIPSAAVTRVGRNHERGMLPSLLFNRLLSPALLQGMSLASLWSSRLSGSGKLLLLGFLSVRRMSGFLLPDSLRAARRLRHLLRTEGLVGSASVLVSIISGKMRACWLRVASRLPYASIGPDCRIRGRRFQIIGKGTALGARCWVEAIGTHRGRAYTPTLHIGSQVSINDDVHIAAAEAVDIGDRCLFGSRIIVTDHNHGQYHGRHPSAPSIPPAERVLGMQAVSIGADTWIGDGVVILPGTRIGRGCIVGANAVVRGIFPDHSVIAGSPARVVRTFDLMRAAWCAPRRDEISDG